MFRAGAGVCVMDGFLYAIGGFDDNAPLNTCERYDMRKDEWTQLANMSCARGEELSGSFFVPKISSLEV